MVTYNELITLFLPAKIFLNMSQILFYVIIAIIILDFLLERYLDYLNIKALKPDVPEDLKDIYDAEKYRKSQLYLKTNTKFSFLTSLFGLVLILIMLFANGFAALDDWVQNTTDNQYVQTLLFFGILGLGYDIITLPFQIYDTFVIEEKFGFNKTTPKTFILDKIKGWFLGGIIGGALLLFLQWAYTVTGSWFWLVALAGTGLFMIFMAMFYTSLIVPLFNKLKPLEEGELRDALEKFASEAGFKLENIYVIDGSKRSTKANAYFSGLGPKKKIILYDTLINDLSTGEIVAVLAHEVGHYKKKHIVKGLVMSLVQSAVMIFLLWFALGYPELSQALGAQKSSFYMGLLAFGLLYSPVSFVMGLISNKFSRKFEYQADDFAASFGLGKKLIDGLIKLSVKNLSNLMPHPLYVFFHYSHPTLLQRKKAIESKF